MKSTHWTADKLNCLLRKYAPPPVTIKWEGGRNVIGVINGEFIGYAQHGILKSDDGTDLGTYERVVEFGGDNGDEHEIKAWAL